MGLRSLIFILAVFIVFSGCVEEKNVIKTNESVYQEPENKISGNVSSTNLSSEVENLPEIELRSLSSIYTHSNAEKIDAYLFSWNNVPLNESESQRLISYLQNDLNINWVDNAQIVKTNNNETIHVFTPENSLELRLRNDKSTILTIIDPAAPSYFFNIKKENGEIRVYKLEEYKYGYNITERHYLVYNLSITNNDSKYLDFKLDELNVRDGDTIYNAENSTIHEPEYSNSFREYMLLDLEKATKIEDKRLYPGQTISGFVIYQVNSSHNSSDDNAFQLSYKEIPVSSDSFKKSNEALNLAERYNYSVVFGIPPYDLYGFVNYANKSTIEFIKKIDSDWLLNDSTENRKLPGINVVYAIKIIPEKSIRSIFESYIPGPHSDPENRFIVIDDTGEELINASKIDKIAILKNQTYELHSCPNGVNGKTPQLNFSNATLVITSYQYKSQGYMLFIDQDLILDDKMNTVEARYNRLKYLGI
jgi:hypothetical protein